MSEMVERCAIAIALASGVSRWENVPEQGDYDSRDYWRRLARANIAAMRTPPRDVLVAGIDKADELVDYDRDTNGSYRCDDSRDAPLPIWQAMIDAALLP